MGAGKYERADQILRYAMGIAVGFGLIVSLLIQIIAGPVVGLFTTDATVILLGAQYIRGYIWDCIFAGVHFSFSGYFCAYGKSEISFVHNLIAILCVRIPGVYLTSKIFPDTLFPMGLADGTILDSEKGILTNGEKTRQLRPQVIVLLKLFLRTENYRLTAEEIDKELWQGKGKPNQLYGVIHHLQIGRAHV